MAVATFVTRIAPFLFFSKLKGNQVMNFVGRYLPLMVMPILVIYSLKDISMSPNDMVPGAAGVAIVVVLHLWQSNALLSIGTGTAAFVLLKHYNLSLPF